MSVLSGSVKPDFGFTGIYQHSRTNLALTWFRQYNPGLGRWLNRDRVGEDVELNLYGYSSNNPISFADPWGLIGGEFVNHMKTGGEPLGDDGVLIALGILNLGLAFASDGISLAAIPSTIYVASRSPQNLNSSCPAPQAAAELGTKLNYLFGQAGGNAHNVTRSTDMARQLASIGFQNTPAARVQIAQHLTAVLNDSSSIVQVQANGRVVRESLLMGPRGDLKVESIWDGTKLITVNLFGKKQ